MEEEDKLICDLCGEDDQEKEFRDLVGYTLCGECYKKHSGTKEDK